MNTMKQYDSFKEKIQCASDYWGSGPGWCSLLLLGEESGPRHASGKYEPKPGSTK